MNIGDLTAARCQALPPGSLPLNEAEIAQLLGHLPGWERRNNTIFKSYVFRSFEHTMAFTNAVAWIAQREDHHPDMSVSFKLCEVSFGTHSISGISLNDFICAAKVEALF